MATENAGSPVREPETRRISTFFDVLSVPIVQPSEAKELLRAWLYLEREHNWSGDTIEGATRYLEIKRKLKVLAAREGVAPNVFRCAKGHTPAGDDLYVRPDGERRCLICIRGSKREWRRNRRSVTT